MTASRMVRLASGWLVTFAAGVALAAPAAAQSTTGLEQRSPSAATTVKTWESAEERLTQLLDQVPEKARPGIERALQANREGRLKAQEALTKGDEQRAQRALELAAQDAERGLSQARLHVPASVLPRLDEAAARMSARQGNKPTGTIPSLETKPAVPGSIERPGPGVPDSMSRPANPNAARPPQRPSGPG